MLVLVWMAGCTKPPRSGDDAPADRDAAPAELERYDPLELKADKQVVPYDYPSDQPIDAGGSTVEDQIGPIGDTADFPIPIDQIDTLNNQAYRVQVLTTKVYGEARAALRVAEEIFDRQVFMDYEVPYFKLRVGNFAKRERAENYQQRARAAGYSNAWVVVVAVGVEELESLYDTLPTPVGDSLDYEPNPGQDD